MAFLQWVLLPASGFHPGLIWGGGGGGVGGGGGGCAAFRVGM